MGKPLYLLFAFILLLVGVVVYISGYADLGDDLANWGLIIFLGILLFMDDKKP